MKLRVTVEVEIDEEALNKEYSGSKVEETLAAYRNEGVMPEETRRMLAMDALDRHHGMPKRCVKNWEIISNELVKE